MSFPGRFLEAYMPNGLPRHFGELLVATSVICAACGGGGGDVQPDEVTIVEAVSGNEQHGRAGEVLVDPIVVRVTSDGNAVPGVTVNWSAPAPSGEIVPDSVATDANGMASAIWMLGTAAGAQTAQAAVSGAIGSPVSFSAAALAAAAATLAKAPGTSGDNQEGEINSLLITPLQAQVTDEFGNPVPGVDVSWAASGATVSAPTGLSDEAGISEVGVTLGSTAGPVTITAAAAGLVGSPLIFNATVVEPVPVPATASVSVGNNFFRSNRNSTQNAAVDTVQVGGTVTWTWVPAAIVHSVDSDGSPGFTDSPLQTGPSYEFTFPTPGTYQYTCAAHPGGMTGRIVVR